MPIQAVRIEKAYVGWSYEEAQSDEEAIQKARNLYYELDEELPSMKELWTEFKPEYYSDNSNDSDDSDDPDNTDDDQSPLDKIAGELTNFTKNPILRAVRIGEIIVGWIYIEAASPEAAAEIAEQMQTEGKKLPELKNERRLELIFSIEDYSGEETDIHYNPVLDKYF